MSPLPRIAVGSVQPNVSSRYATWAVMSLLRRAGHQVRHFQARACFAPWDGATPTTGFASRHLDSWLMTPEVCREVFAHGADGANLSVVEGDYSLASSERSTADNPASPTLPDFDRVCQACGGRLDVLCDWLKLPRIGVLDVARLDRCRIRRPAVDALLLDNVPSRSDFFRLQTTLEPLWGIPVVGGLEVLPALRGEMERLPTGTHVPTGMCRELGIQMERLTDADRILQMARRFEFPDFQRRLFPAESKAPKHPVRIAVAYDDAFNCYFPDTLDLFDLHGVQVLDFSPLRDGDLPGRVDIVYVGCGHPERFARELSQNYCLLAAIRNHVCAGRRIYAEGGGLAYLCRQITTGEGRTIPMTGILPAVAHYNALPCVRPAEVMFSSDCWLGRTGTRLRGYLNSRWLLEPTGPLTPHAADAEAPDAVVGRKHALASRLHLDFALQPDAFASFLRPQEMATERTPAAER
ncbi:MAG: hypothetical protein HYS13_12930 [Planctomycetia bacterium]|nr:hypothetical protein [Planctomycetia bacterium]